MKPNRSSQRPSRRPRALAQAFESLEPRKLLSGGPIGDEFQMNTSTAGWQLGAAVAGDGLGHFVVVWHDTYEGDYNIVGQRFDANGDRIGPEFPVNTYTTGHQLHARVAAAPSGFVVTWDSDDEDGIGVFAQRFDSEGARAGADSKVRIHPHRAGVAEIRRGVSEIRSERWPAST